MCAKLQAWGPQLTRKHTHTQHYFQGIWCLNRTKNANSTFCQNQNSYLYWIAWGNCTWLSCPAETAQDFSSGVMTISLSLEGRKWWGAVDRMLRRSSRDCLTVCPSVPSFIRWHIPRLHHTLLESNSLKMCHKEDVGPFMALSGTFKLVTKSHIRWAVQQVFQICISNILVLKSKKKP